MSYYHVENGEIIKRLPRPVVKRSLYEDEQGNVDEAAFNAAQAERNVYPEHVIEPELEDWERRGPVTRTFNTQEKRVETTWPVETRDLAVYKRGLVRAAISEGIADAEFHERELMWAIADHALPVNVIPSAYRNAILSAEQDLITAIASKVQAIRQAATHADAKTASEA